MPRSFESRTRTLSVGLALASLATAAAVHAQSSPPSVMFVDASAPPGGDGSDWLHAFRDLQDALVRVPSNPGGTTSALYEIRIAQGIYRPDRATLDRSASFVVNSAAVLFGGFAGLQSSTPDAWSPSDFVSVLSGDLRSDDGPNFSNMSDNSLHVLTLRGSMPFTALPPSREKLLGLTIRSGNADAPWPDNVGAGVFSRYGAAGRISIESCKFQNNRADYAAGLYFASSETLILSGSEITGNLGTAGVAGACLLGPRSNLSGVRIQANTSTGNTVPGGGVFAQNADVYSCTVIGNTAPRGAGLALYGQSSIQTSTIAGNSATSSGGGIFLDSAASCSTDSCLIAHNTAPNGAGIDSQGYLTVRSCTIVGNAAGQSGGGVRMASAPATTSILNTILWNNTSPTRTNVASLGGLATIDTSLVQSGSTSVDATLLSNVSAADPQFVDPVGSSPLPTSWQDKNYRLRPASPGIDAAQDPPVQYAWGYQDAGNAFRYFNATCTAYAKTDIGAFEFTGSICQPERPITYVRASAAAGGDGRSWATAFRDLYDALATPGVTTIWIAEGTYRPDRGTGLRLGELLIQKPGVNLIGGFAGTETTIEQRDIPSHPTVISGDLLRNDTPFAISRLDNSISLLSIQLPSSSTSGVLVSGITFTGARSDSGYDLPVSISAGSGPARIEDCAFTDNTISGSVPPNTAGALYAGPQASILRCTFTNNTSSGGGAAIVGTTLSVSDCLFSNNLAGGSGGAVYTYGPLSLARCRFENNAVVNSGLASGGAAHSNEGVTVDACRFIGNIAMNSPSSGFSTYTARAAALDFGEYFTHSTITNSLFAGNRVIAAIPGESTLFANGFGLVSNCTFADNVSSSSSAGPGTIAAVNALSTFTYANCIFWNSPLAGAGSQSSFGELPSSAAPTIANCLLQGPVPTSALNTRSLDPRFTNPAGPDGIIGTADDDYSLRPDSPAIDAADASLLTAGIALDAAGHPRFFDAPTVANSGLGIPNYLDIGALEFDGRACPADFNASGALSAQDIFDFLSAWFAASPAADFNRSSTITAQDIFDFLNAWFAGC